MRNPTTRVLTAVAAAAATAGASGLAVSAVHRRSRRPHQSPQLHTPLTDMQLETWRHQSERKDQVLAAVAGYLGALSRGEQPPPWPPESGEVAAGPETAVLGRLLEMVRDREASTRSAAVALARSWQAESHRLQKVADGMLDRHAEHPDVIEDAYRVAHTAAMLAHRTQSLTLLCGAGLGQQWPSPMPLGQVIRSAIGRITDYQRVQVAEALDVAVTAAAAEAVIHLIAALLANATQASPPSAPVYVAFTAVDGGHAITVTDDGSGLSADRMRWADERASGREPVGLADLGSPPQTGLAVIGYLAREYALRVRLDQSVYGGVTATVTVPEHLLVAVDTTTTPPPPPPRAPATPLPSAPAPAGSQPERTAPPTTTGGLPKRARGQSPLPPAPQAAPPPPVAPTRTPEETGAFLTQLAHGAAAATPGSARPDDEPTTDEEQQR